MSHLIFLTAIAEARQADAHAGAEHRRAVRTAQTRGVHGAPRARSMRHRFRPVQRGTDSVT